MSLQSRLDNLKQQRDDLKANLGEKGVTGLDDLTKFDELVPKVLEITQGEGGTDTDDATALSSDLLNGKTAYARGNKITGTIQTYSGNTTFLPGVNQQTINTNGKYMNSNIYIQGDPDLIPDNIASGVTIFGVEGTGVIGGTDTSDGNATSSDLLKDKIAYANGSKIVGTLETYDGRIENSNPVDITKTNIEITPSVNDQKMLTAGTKVNKNIIIKGDPDLIASNIILGANIFGVEGTATTTEADDSDDCTATRRSIMFGRTAVVGGHKLTGELDLSLLPSLTNGDFVNGGDDDD